jgi:hypothetical protein
MIGESVDARGILITDLRRMESNPANFKKSKSKTHP